MPAEIQNFLVATDGSESAGRALDVAAEMAKAAHGTLRIVTVGESPTVLQQMDFRPAEGNMADLTERLLEEAQQRAGWTGVRPVKTSPAVGRSRPSNLRYDYGGEGRCNRDWTARQRAPFRAAAW